MPAAWLDLGDFCLWGSTICLIVWIGQYTEMEQWWRNAIGIRLIGLAVVVVVIYIPSLMALADPAAFAGFASTRWYQYLVLGTVIASFIFIVLGNITWWRIRRAKKSRQASPP